MREKKCHYNLEVKSKEPGAESIEHRAKSKEIGEEWRVGVMEHWRNGELKNMFFRMFALSLCRPVSSCK